MPNVFRTTFGWYASGMDMPQRRSRMRRTRSGKPLALTTRDLDFFRLLTGYRYLRSTYLHAFVGGASETRFKERLGDLFHEGYLDRPAEQWTFADARYEPCVYEIGPGGLRALTAAGTSAGDARTWLGRDAQRQFRHGLMICECLASIELATLGRDDLRFIPWAEIALKLPPSAAQSPAPFKLPLGSSAVIPDALFGLEYRKDGRKSYRFFVLEADRGTMPVYRARDGQTSYLGKLDLYRRVLDGQLYRSHWGVPNLFVLTVTSDTARLADMLRKLDGEHPLFLMKAATAKELIQPAPALLAEPWSRPGLSPFRIDG